MDLGVQTEFDNTAKQESVGGEGVQRQRRRPKVDHCEGQQRRQRRRAGRKTKAESCEALAAAVVVECNDSDAENALCEEMAQRLISVQRASANAEDDGGEVGETTTETEHEEEESGAIVAVARTKTAPSKRRGGGRRWRSNHRNASGAADEKMTIDTGVRRLAPMSETSQFLPVSTEETPRPTRRVLRSRRMV